MGFDEAINAIKAGKKKWYGLAGMVQNYLFSKWPMGHSRGKQLVPTY